MSLLQLAAGASLGLAALLLGGFLIWKLVRSGEQKQQLRDAEANVKVKDAQLQIAANPPSDADVIDRLRRSGF